MTIAELLAEFARWLYVPDPVVLHGVLAAVAGNRLAGDPVWLWILGPPGSGKTEPLNAFDRLAGFHQPDEYTVAGLLRAGRKGKAAGALARIMAEGGFGMLAVKDLSTLFADPGDRRRVLAALRRVYEGAYEREIGAAGRGAGRLRFEGKVGMLAAGTEDLDRHANEVNALGARAVLLRTPDVDEDALLEVVAHNAGRQAEMRDRLARCVEEFFAGLDFDDERPGSGDSDALRALTRLSVRARSAVPREPAGDRAIETVPRPEVPTRVYGNLLQLHSGALAVGLDTASADALVRRVALDSIPDIRARILDRLCSGPTAWTARTLGDAIGRPTVVVRRGCEDFAALGVATRTAARGGGEHCWVLSDAARALARRAGFGLHAVSDGEAGSGPDERADEARLGDAFDETDPLDAHMQEGET